MTLPTPASTVALAHPGPIVSRRAFVATTGLTAASLVFSAGRACRAWAGQPVAGPVVEGFPIPADKKFDPAWLYSLTDRGQPTIYRSSANELRHIGMPIGGIGCGQLYLSGDGRLWHWDIFNLPAPPEWRDCSGGHYAKPAAPSAPIEQGFALRITQKDQTIHRRLDSSGFSDIRFAGRYPMATVEYHDPSLPVEAALEAFSPFIPLSVDDSSLPATILTYTVKNLSQSDVDIELGGWLQNPVCLSGGPGQGTRRCYVSNAKGLTMLACHAGPNPKLIRDGGGGADVARSDVPFEDFEKPTYEGWAVTGTAFGDGPVEVAKRPAYMGDLNAQGKRAVNTHNVSHGEDVVKADTHIGTLTSRDFTIERRYISFLIGGGNHPGQECLNLLIDGAPVRTATGRNSNRMRIENFDVREYAGKKARIQIVDAVTGGWGQIGIDDIVFCDEPRVEPYIVPEQPDYGSMVLALVGDPVGFLASASVNGENLPSSAFRHAGLLEHTEPFQSPLIGALARKATLKPSESATWTFIVAWYFPGLWWDSLSFIDGVRKLRRHYGPRFKDAEDVARFISGNLDRLVAQTRLWTQTWYDSTLPYWFLDRTFATASTPATSTCYRFDNGRFYGWEGVYSCAGTCTHVWQYAHAVARLFPSLERGEREMIDFGQEFDDATGIIHYRGEAARELAIDGQAGTILRAYREHQMAPDTAFLRKTWPRIKKATELLISRDDLADGILDGPQYNTLDTAWYGQIAWISSLYLAAVRAAEAMAREMNDSEFAQRCAGIAERGFKNLPDRLFNGEYFINIPDTAHPEANNTGQGCHIDQLLGQSWAHQVGLPRIVPIEPSQSALRSLYKYSLATDIGPYRAYAERTVKGGRWYAMPGEGGLLMCTFPKGGSDTAAGKGQDAWAAGYFNECMSGFEHQVAAHMLWENLIPEGLAVIRLIHDRYHASRRNPYNEIECGDHYSRAMAAFGVYLAALGYEHHGPRGHVGFAPRISPDKFKAAFTACEGWGTFEQAREGPAQRNAIYVRYGKLRLKTIALDLAAGAAPKTSTLSLSVPGAGPGGRHIPARLSVEGERATLSFLTEFTLNAGEQLNIELR